MAVRQITCLCETQFERDFPDMIDLEKEPETVDAVRSGEFLSVSCPECGRLLKPEFPVQLVDRSRQLDIFFVPELERNAYLRGRLEYSVPECNRVVVGYPELVEKLAIADADLDDQGIEVAKYYLLSKALEEYQDREPVFSFKAKDGKALVFHVQGIRDDEIGVSRVPIETYERVLSQLPKLRKQDPFSEILSPPYVSVNKVYRDQLL